MSEVTRILEAIEAGQPRAADELLPLVYEELRRLAADKMAREPPGQTLQATALVHEAYLRLVGTPRTQWNSRGHFFAAAAEAMRRILVENARRRQRIRHGGALQRVDVEEVNIACACPEDKVLLVNEALEALAAEDPIKARVVTLHYLAGLNGAETAEALGVSEKTVQRAWAFAKVWLYEWIQNASQR